MKRKIIFISIIAAISLSILLLLPTQVFAELPPGNPGESLAQLSVSPSDSATDSIFTLWLSNLIPGDFYSYEFSIFRYEGTLEQLANTPDPYIYLEYLQI